jgi:ribosome recycling factor
VHEFASLHTGKASPAMVEDLQVHVEAYGSSMRIRDVATVSTPDNRSIVITPWDKSVLKDIEKGIQIANLGFNPSIQGNLVRVPVPELSGDRRKELVKVAATMAEQGRIAVRHARHHALEPLKKLEKDSAISEDDLHRYEKDIQKAHDAAIQKINEAFAKKEKDLTTV